MSGLRRGLGDGRDVSRLRTRNAYFGTFIEGAYIYRLKAAAGSLREADLNEVNRALQP